MVLFEWPRLKEKRVSFVLQKEIKKKMSPMQKFIDRIIFGAIGELMKSIAPSEKWWPNYT